MKKVAIVGLGNVGTAYLNALITEKNLVNEIVLIDTDKDKLNGEYLDVKDSLAVIDSSINIIIGNYSELKNADILVIAAGRNQKEGETRLDLLNDNASIVKSIAVKALINGFKGIFIVATNPVDIMSYLVYKVSNFSPNRVIGSGTLLDTARLKNIISEKAKVNTSDIDINVIGEHGDHSVVLWSKGRVGSVDITNIYNEKDLGIFDEKLKNSAYDIINKKGYTNEGISLSLLKITKAILNNENKILNISTFYKDVYIGMPSVIGINGVKGIINMDLSDEEENKLNLSINIIKEAIESMEV
jgi:L-lactate dehydrogenase